MPTPMPRPLLPHAWLLATAAALAAPGCRPAAPAGGAGATKLVRKGGADRPETYRLTGVVRNADPKTGVVTIRHDAIPGFMGAMTMPFTLKDRSLLDDVHPGDEVEGSLRVVREGGEVQDYELTDLIVSRTAPPAPLSLNLAGGAPSVGPAAKALKPGDPVPDFAMTGQDGKTFRLSDLRGKVVALTFVYTRCPLPDFCPRMDAKFAEASSAAAAVPGRAEHLRFLSVSFDPEHDAPEVLARHAEARGARPPLWTFAVAQHDELARVAGPLGLSYGPTRGEIIHNLTLAVVDPGGALARLETGPAARGWATADLLKLMYSRIRPSKN